MQGQTTTTQTTQRVVVFGFGPTTQNIFVETMESLERLRKLQEQIWTDS